MQIVSNDQKALNVALAESEKGQEIPLSKGPFTFSIQDPANTCTVTPGTPDQTTPLNFKPNGSGATGTVTFTVTDTSATPPLVSNSVSFDVVAPAPPVPDTLTASVVPAP